jgi:plastocyanin
LKIHHFLIQKQDMSILKCTIPVGLLVLAAACGGGDREAASAGALNTDAAAAESDAAQTAAQVSPGGATAPGAGPATAVSTPAGDPETSVAPDAGRQVIEIHMVMPGGANPAFEPAQITAKPGDVLRFVNKENVHNVHFTTGPSGATLPPASPYLTQPGQVYELKVNLPAGSYDFQCDPHLAMGMVGVLTVTG